MTIQEALKYDDGQIDPDAYPIGTANGAWVSMADFTEAAAIVMVGLMGATATVTAKVEQAQSATGTGAKDLTGASVLIDQAAGAGDEIATGPFRAEQLDIANDYTHVRLSVATAGASVDYGAALVRGGAGRLPQTNT